MPRWKFAFLVILLPLLSLESQAEGTKQFMPNSGTDIRVQIFDNGDINRDFMTYIADTASRLHIRISDVNTEVIHFGFRQDNGDVYYRLRDPLGNIVYGPFLVPSSGNGYLGTYNEAVAGPSIIDATNGYPSLSYTPSIPGDYYIEFNRGDPDNFINGTSNVKRLFNFFDITVVDVTDSTAIEGRLWSKAWDFNCMSFSNPFEANIHIYHSDSILSSIDFNGIQPFGFVIYSNSTGVFNTGNVQNDRQSVTGQVTDNPTYQIFLQMPDTNEFPITQRVPSLTGPTTLEGCNLLNWDITINASHNGVVDMFIDFNGNNVYDAGTQDVQFLQNLSPGPNVVPWDGNDGLGAPVPDGTVANLLVTYQAGVNHIPLFDVENHTNGFIVNTIAPPGGVQDVFWDDSNLSGGSTNLITACNGACHTWGNTQGNNNTVNTWWITHFDFDTLSFTIYSDCVPEANRDTAYLPFNVGGFVDVQANDVEPDGDPMTTTIVTGPVNGGAVVTGTGITYTPNSGYIGVDSVVYSICDNNSPPPILCDTSVLYIVVECDDDGVTGPFETNIDSDGDGIDNECDIDSDNDGITDAVEGNVDTDGDGLPDFVDLDSDNDGIPDAIEANGGVAPAGYDAATGRITGTDTDADGLINSVDNAPGTQYGAGSISTLSDPDTDGDSYVDRVDKDSDNDGILDIIEAGGSDSDGDGEVDSFTDINSDGIQDLLLANPLAIPNTDGTGGANYLDNDSDGDGITDNREGQSTAAFGTISSFSDSDGDGIIDDYDTDNGNNPISPVDTDNDGQDDYVDTDSDNDSILDIVESNDANNDGVVDSSPSGTDADGDGIDDGLENDGGASFGGYSNLPLQNLDGDAEPDWRDLDDDGDGISTIDETTDADLTLIPDYLEVSPCGPGTVQQGVTVISGNGDAVFSQTGVTNPNNALNAPDGAYAEIRNGDNIVIDLTDVIDAGQNVALTVARIQTSGAAAGADIEQSLNGTTFSNLQSYTSTASQPTFETFNYTVNGSGARYIRVTRTARGVALDAMAYSYATVNCVTDTDNDGVPDTADIDDDNDGIPDSVEGTADTDGDGITDDLDLDSDNDGIPDAVEANSGELPPNMSSQGKYTGGYAKANDADGDGLVDDVDPTTGGSALADPNTDGVGPVDRLDLDSDGDGLVDAVEANSGTLPANMNSNGQYPVAYATANDADGDGYMDDLDPDQIGTALAIPDSDTDGAPDYLDLDSDGDGDDDNSEGFSPAVTPSGTDTDGDGIDDAFDPDCTPCGSVTGTVASLPDSDSDGIPDYLDQCFVSQMAGSWNNPAVWGGAIPNCSDCVFIQHALTLNGPSYGSNVAIISGGSIALNNNTLSICGNLTNAGSGISGSGTVSFDGSVPQQIDGAVDIDNLTVTNSNGVSIGNSATVTVTGTVTLTNGDLDNSFGGTLILDSDNSGTAMASGSGTGDFNGTVEGRRYVDGCAGWLSIGAPFNSTFADFNFLPFQGFPGSYFPSATFNNTYTYDETAAGDAAIGYNVATNITNNLVKGQGFLIYADAVTLPNTFSIAGDMSLGTFNFPVSYTTTTGGNTEDGFNLLGNPYPATIDWSSASGWTKTGLCDAIYTYNRCLQQYSSYVAGISVNGGSPYISPYSGFWIKAHNASAGLTVNRNAIVDVQQDLYSQLPLSVLKAKVEAFGYSDECAISFGDTVESNGLGSWYGATKFFSGAAWFPVLYTKQFVNNDTFDMSINMMAELNQDSVIQMQVSAQFTAFYTMTFEGMESFDPSVCILLEDTILNTWTDLRVDTTYTFVMDTSSVHKSRFRIHFNTLLDVETQNPSCSGVNDGQAIATATGMSTFTWKNSNGQVIQQTTTPAMADTLQNVPPGIYTVVMVDTSVTLCGHAETTVVLDAPTGISAQLQATPASLCGEEDGAISVSQVTGGIPPYNYYWSNGSSQMNLDSIGGGTYQLVVTDSVGCQETFLTQVNSPAQISAYFNPDFDTLPLTDTGAVFNFQNVSVGGMQFDWDFGDGSPIDTNINPVHAYQTVGTYVVTLDAFSNGCSDQFIYSVVVTDSITSVEEITRELTPEIRIYPNPSQGHFLLETKNFPVGSKTLSVTDLLGREILRLQTNQANNQPLDIDLTGFETGTYILRLNQQKITLTEKLFLIN